MIAFSTWSIDNIISLDILSAYISGSDLQRHQLNQSASAVLTIRDISLFSVHSGLDFMEFPYYLLTTHQFNQRTSAVLTFSDISLSAVKIYNYGIHQSHGTEGTICFAH